jgi:TM2 domain-containing membrane protein YozV
MRVTTAERTRALEKSTIFLICLTGWLVPGAGHFWLKRPRKGIVFLVMLVAMFLTGVALEGRIFPFEPSQPLVALAAIADLGIGAVYFLAWAVGWGAGRVVAPTYEYGNTFLIVAGLLNLLVVIDAYDVALGRK